MHLRVAVLAVLAACGGSKPKSGPQGNADAPDTATTSRSERTLDQWTTADEDQAIAASCRSLVGADGRFRCDFMERAGMRADRCVEQMRSMASAKLSTTERHAFRELLVTLTGAQSCEQVAEAFQTLVTAMRSERNPQNLAPPQTQAGNRIATWPAATARCG